MHKCVWYITSYQSEPKLVSQTIRQGTLAQEYDITGQYNIRHNWAVQYTT